MRQRLTSFGAFCYLWLMVGFFTGTLLLVGPVRFITAELQARGWTDEQESWAMLGVIAVYVLASAALALWLFRRAASCRTRRMRLAIPIALTVAAVASLWAWMNPTVLATVAGGVAGEVKSGNAEFVFGPYPEPARLDELKKDGYAGVISLQHPAVLPFEPPGIAKEKAHAEKIGLPFIHAPMMPWVSANDESLEKIRQLARTARGRYYVHCGLGRDRANVVKRMLEREGAQVAASGGFLEAGSFRKRLTNGRGPFERGEIRELEHDVWLIPYPNKHELFGNMLSGQVKHVLMLLDPNNPTEKPWLDEGTRLFTEFAVPFSVDQLPPYDRNRALMIARKVHELPRPVAVIVPFTRPHGPTLVADTFVEAYVASRQQ